MILALDSIDIVTSPGSGSGLSVPYGYTFVAVGFSGTAVLMRSSVLPSSMLTLHGTCIHDHFDRHVGHFDLGAGCAFVAVHHEYVVVVIT